MYIYFLLLSILILKLKIFILDYAAVNKNINLTFKYFILFKYYIIIISIKISSVLTTLIKIINKNIFQ